MKELIVSPSILSLDFSRPGEQLDALANSHAQWLHFDVMDGHFVPNLTFGPDILRGFRKALPQKMDVHIMVEDARTYADVFIDAGADVLTFHSEALEDDLDAILSLCAHIRERGVLAGVSICPNTPVEPLLDHLAEMDVLLVMSVEPGFGGQSFMEGMLEKVKKARARIEAQGLSTRIEIDGGINAQTGALAVAAGCDTLVAGSYIFRQDIHAGIDSLLCLR
ncbi:ribulose-phosphate 3-epimerase [Amedibacillus dolichus]|uniref:Ribulose-phosphate 3-epimerase n=1 Tax=Amedibacillus dolichus TaxID=31971 RepID=A0ABT7UCF0_9FIRM|nr:ribulose-phosphate 3-epimerase [Amedibacillus dolichus]MDM8157296.1 ribulose-phosphate 3-epimerase [Amedibacillus dolichus]